VTEKTKIQTPPARTNPRASRSADSSGEPCSPLPSPLQTGQRRCGGWWWLVVVVWGCVV
jgi:hypothetical protein